MPFQEKFNWFIALFVTIAGLILGQCWFLQRVRQEKQAEQLKWVMENREVDRNFFKEQVDRKLSEELKTQDTLRAVTEHILSDKDRISNLEKATMVLDGKLRNIVEVSRRESEISKPQGLSVFKEMFEGAGKTVATAVADKDSEKPVAKVEVPPMIVEEPEEVEPELTLEVEITEKVVKGRWWKPWTWKWFHKKVLVAQTD